MSNLPDILTLDSQVKMPLMQLPTRTPVVRLSHGVVMMSPGPNCDFSPCSQFGTITDIVAPTTFHHLGVQKAVQAFPSARLWGVAGFADKRPDIPWNQTLTGATWPYHDELPLIELQGLPKINEVVFFHRKSKSLLVSDLCFNMVNARGFGAWLILNLFGTYRRFSSSRLFLKFVQDRAAFEQSLTQLFDFDFDRIIMSHGEIVASGGREKLLAALAERGYRPAAKPALA